MIRALTALVTLLFLSACGIARADHDAILAENGRLQAQLDELRAEVAALTAEPTPSAVVLANTETRVLESAVNDQRYLIKVAFPRGYDAEDATYPVLYVTDAETNFGAVSYIVQRLIKDELIPKILVVGIAYDTDYDTFYRLRSRDLTPIEITNLRYSHSLDGSPDPTGGAPLFSRFLAEELFPFIEETYRVTPDDRALYGHSYGGLFGSWVLLNRPELFQRYLLLSPSLWFGDRLLLRDVESADLRFQPTRLYMGSGRLEPRIDDFQEDFVATVRRRQPANLMIRSEVLDDETHRTIFGRGFTNGLRYLYAE